MCTASSSGSLRRTLAQFARLPLARIEIQTPGTLLVDLSGIGKFCCPVQPVIYIYYYCINTIHSLHLAERKWHVLVMFHQTTDPDTLLSRVIGKGFAVTARTSLCFHSVSRLCLDSMVLALEVLNRWFKMMSNLANFTKDH